VARDLLCTQFIMTSRQRTVGRWLIDSLRRIAALEYAFLDACESAARSAGDVLFAMRVGAAQVHLFDLGTALRELGDGSLSYSACVRQSLLHGGTPEAVLRRLESESERALSHKDTPEGLRTLLRSNLAEHRSLLFV
jgi:hypothetical protein